MRYSTPNYRAKHFADFHANTSGVLLEVMPRPEIPHLATHLIASLPMRSTASADFTLRGFLAAVNPGNREVSTGAAVVARTWRQIAEYTDQHGPKSGARSERAIKQATAEFELFGLFGTDTAESFVLVCGPKHSTPGVPRRFHVSASGVSDRRTAVRRLMPDVVNIGPDGRVRQTGDPDGVPTALWTPERIYDGILANGTRWEAEQFIRNFVRWLKAYHRRNDAADRAGRPRSVPKSTGTRPVDDAEHRAERDRVKAARNGATPATCQCRDCTDKGADFALIEAAELGVPRKRHAREKPRKGFVGGVGRRTSRPGAPAATGGNVNDSAPPGEHPKIAASPEERAAAMAEIRATLGARL